MVSVLSPVETGESETEAKGGGRASAEHLRVVSPDEADASSAPIAWDHSESTPIAWDHSEPTPVRLHHFPTSPGSQQVRLALAEKAVQWDSHLVNTGPKLENFAPKYAKLNPRLTVPTLEVGDEVIAGPLKIVEYIDENFSGPALIPDDPEARAEVERWIALHARFPLRLLNHARSKGMVRWFQRWSLRHQTKRLRKLLRRNPELREVYTAKLESLEEFREALRDRPALTRLVDEVEELLDEFDSLLEERKWLAGDRYTMADLAWTPVVAQLEHIGFARSLSERRRPHLHRWYEQLRARASWGSMIRRLSASQAMRFYGPAVAKSLAIAWAIKWAITGIAIAIGWLLAHS